MRKSLRYLVIPLFLASAQALSAQYGQLLDSIAGQAAVSVGASIRLAGVASKSIAPEAGEAEARTALEQLGIRLPAGPDDRAITYGEFADLLVQLFDLPAGFAYRLFPSPHAAFRELQSRGLIPESARTGSLPTGTEALSILRSFVDLGKARP